jgi:hypothetical protein
MWGHTTSSTQMIDELETTWKEAVVTWSRDYAGTSLEGLKKLRNP